VIDGGSFTLGAFRFSYVPLAHSIPEGNALRIETPYGTIFHTGDWKLDDQPLIGTPATPEALQAIGDQGVLALVCDSTNVFNPQASGSEGAVRKGLGEAIAAATGRVLVTTFASNAARLQTLGEVAADTGRRLCIAGRSLERIIRVAQQTGYLGKFPETVDFDTAMRLPSSQVLIVATGGQGEPRAALSRIAEGAHPLKLGAGDTVVFSSRQIPGNELAIGRIMNLLAVKGVTMITDHQAFVHVSGHPGRPELAEMYRRIRPQILLPVHGEDRHLAEQARFGRAQGIPRAVVQHNGEIVRLAPGAPEKLGQVAVGRLIVDGDVILPADGATMTERRRVAQRGQVSVAVAIDRDGRLKGIPQVRAQGVPVEEEREKFLTEAAEAAALAGKPGSDPARLRETVRLAVRRCATRWTGKKPVVDVLVVEV
jgi:ribonuclease J